MLKIRWPRIIKLSHESRFPIKLSPNLTESLSYLLTLVGTVKFVVVTKSLKNLAQI